MLLGAADDWPSGSGCVPDPAVDGDVALDDVPEVVAEDARLVRLAELPLELPPMSAQAERPLSPTTAPATIINFNIRI